MERPCQGPRNQRLRTSWNFPSREGKEEGGAASRNIPSKKSSTGSGWVGDAHGPFSGIAQIAKSGFGDEPQDLPPVERPPRDGLARGCAPQQAVRKGVGADGDVCRVYEVFSFSLLRMAFPALKNGTCFAATSTASPVRGLRPGRA